MSQIFVGQTALRVECHTNVEVSGSIERKVKYLKTHGTSGYWPADIDGTGTSSIIYHDIGSASSSALNVAGIWKFWSWVKFEDGRIAQGDVKEERIYEEGETAM